MSGAVSAAKDVVKITAAPMYAPVLAGVNMAKGKGLGESIGSSLKPAVKSGMSIAGEALGAINPSDPLPNIAVDDPSAIAAKNATERARVKRQTEIDLLTDRPGRGASILTDNYSYKV